MRCVRGAGCPSSMLGGQRACCAASGLPPNLASTVGRGRGRRVWICVSILASGHWPCKLYQSQEGHCPPAGTSLPSSLPSLGETSWDTGLPVTSLPKASLCIWPPCRLLGAGPGPNPDHAHPSWGHPLFPSLFAYRYKLVEVGLGALQRCGWLPGPSRVHTQGKELLRGKL